MFFIKPISDKLTVDSIKRINTFNNIAAQKIFLFSEYKKCIIFDLNIKYIFI